jgi:hypothetical protein
MRAKHVKYLVVAIVATVATAYLVISSARSNQARAKAVVRMFGGEESLDIVVHPRRVEAYRLGALPELVNWQNATLSDYPMTAGPVEVPAAISSELSKTLSAAGSYGWDYAKGCAPRYGVGITFRGSVNRIDVLFCFECDVLLVARDGSIIGGEDFDDIRPSLVRAVKVLFPSDSVIQNLRENRGR